MNEFETYNLYLALKNHFTNKSYDFIKYNGKVKTNYNSFLKRKDKIFFQKLAKHSDLRNFLLANFIKHSKIWVRDLAYSSECEKIYQDWLKTQQSLTYIFKTDLSKLDDSFNDLFVIKNNEHPKIIKSYLANQISLETFCILIELSQCIGYWNKKLEYDPIWEDLYFKIQKYTPFISYDKEKFKSICLDYFSEI